MITFNCATCGQEETRVAPRRRTKHKRVCLKCKHEVYKKVNRNYWRRKHNVDPSNYKVQ